MRNLSILLGAICICATTARPIPANSPEESLRSIHLHPGFRVELMAAEPLVADPISIAWGADGTLWVVEMGDYPVNAKVGEIGAGRIRVLHDEDGDGRYDRSRLFLDGLRFPTSVLPWRRGALISCAPHILYAEDTDDDGTADRREILFTGFVEGNPQHNINGLCYGLDGWVYGANGENGGTIESRSTGEKVDIRGRDFRILPEQGVLDPQTGMSQFTRCRDDWGNWFGGNSVYPFWHCVVADRYIRRNRYIPSIDVLHHVISPPLYAPVYPTSGPAVRFNEPHSARRFTSACGATVYRDELFGSAFSNAYFICEPAHNLVRAERMMPRGTTFVSEPLLAGRELEFFASSDPACRPTMAKTGPDGALWIVDMYRQIIEHPDYIPRSLHRDIDFRAGAGKGRIYRVLPGDTIPRPIKRLDRLDTAALVASLSSPNGPQRDVAQQLLVERRSREAIPLLERLAVKGNRATCRLQALATLGVMAPVDKAILRSCLRDEHPAVRRHALQIGESELATAPQLQEAVLELVDDRDAQVRLQLACSLGQWQDRRAAHALAHLASRHTEDPFLHAAVLSSATIYVDLVLEEVLAERALDSHHAPLIRDLILMTLDCGEEAAFASALQKVAAPRDGAQASWQLSVVAGLLDGLERRGSSLNDLYEQSGEDLRMAVRSLGHIFQTARRTALDQQAPTAERVQAVRLLGRGRTGRDRDIDDLVSLVTPQSSIAVQEEAIATLGHLSETEGLQRLLTEWDQHLPTIREKILDHVLMRTSWTVCLLEGLETQQISPATIDPRYRFSLLTHRSEEIRNRSREAFQRAIGPDREAVVRSYQTALKREGDVDRGKRIFDRTCAACHESTAANHIGPDLGALQERSAESLLIDTLDPNRAIDPRFIGYVAITKDGRTWTGILASETDNSIALVDPHGVRHVLLRSEIEGLDCTNKSLMPEGLETEIRDPQAMADLLSFLRKQASGRAEDVE